MSARGPETPVITKVSADEAAARGQELLDRARTAAEPLIIEIERHGRTEAVVMSASEYDRYRRSEALRLLDELQRQAAPLTRALSEDDIVSLVHAARRKRGKPHGR